MASIAIALAVTAAACTLFIVLIRTYNALVYLPKLQQGQAPLPKGRLGLPLLGESLELFRAFSNDPDSFWKRRFAWYGKGEGLFKTHLFGSPVVMVAKPDMMRAILLGRGDDAFGPGWPKATTSLVGGQSFLALSGDEYKRLRRLAFTSVNSPSVLADLVSSVEDLTQGALHKWSLMGQVILVDELLELTFTIIAGLLVRDLPKEEIKAACREFGHLNAGVRSLPINMPGFAFHNALKAREKLVKRMQGYIDARLAHPERMLGDVLESLMSLSDETGIKMSKEQIIDCILTFLLAGHESSAHTAMWIMIFLAKNPDKLQKLWEEQTRIIAEKGNARRLSVADYKRMNYLYMVIDETLRIVTISPFTFRAVTSTVEINGYTIPKGWKLAFWNRALHLNEDIFPDPYTFRPERWQNIILKAGMYVPFGLGGRSCIGMDLAKLELAVLVHTLVVNYRWELVNPNCKAVYLPRPRPIDGCPVRLYKR